MNYWNFVDLYKLGPSTRTNFLADSKSIINMDMVITLIYILRSVVEMISKLAQIFSDIQLHQSLQNILLSIYQQMKWPPFHISHKASDKLNKPNEICTKFHSSKV